MSAEDDLVDRVRVRAAEVTNDAGDGDPSGMHVAIGRHLIEIPWLHSAPGDEPPPRLPPCDPAALDRTEAALGVQLPPLLRRLYLEVGEGGYGPGDGIVGLAKLVEEHQSYAVELAEGQELGEWPAGLLPFCQLDQTLTACIDCNTPAGAIIGFDFDELDFDDPDTWDGSFSPRSPSLHEWLAGWLDGGTG